MLTRALVHEKYSQIQNFIEFEDRLDRSLQRDIIKIDHVRMRFVVEPPQSETLALEISELDFMFISDRGTSNTISHSQYLISFERLSDISVLICSSSRQSGLYCPARLQGRTCSFPRGPNISWAAHWGTCPSSHYWNSTYLSCYFRPDGATFSCRSIFASSIEPLNRTFTLRIYSNTSRLTTFPPRFVCLYSALS